MRKLGTTQVKLLEEILHQTSISVRKDERTMRVYCYFQPDCSMTRKMCLNLASKGFLREVVSCFELTQQAWDYLNTSPIQALINETKTTLRYELEYQRNARTNDTPRYTDYTVTFYRELYKNPEMTCWQVYSLERERVFSNQINHEERIQEIEHELARYEVIALRSH